VRLVLKHQPLWGDAAPFHALLRDFERANPGVTVVPELLPNASDLAHQFFLTSLEGGASDFDVFVADVVWVPEFARAGWVADLSAHFPPARLREDFLPGPVESVVLEGRTWAVPWFVDVGLLYYRTDLVPRAPRTYAELASFAREAVAKGPPGALVGYVWQGRQYEGLTCNVYEALWGHGGEALAGGRLQLDTPPMREALGHLRGLLASGLSPPSVTSAAEEEARRLFQEGRAVFMRNWPYAWAEAQAAGSPVRGKVGVAPLPTRDGRPGAGALGGWHLAVNAHVPPERREAAARLVRHLTSLEANRVMALRYARNPPRRDAYADPALREGAPFIAGLLPAVEAARPRPVTPYYTLLADILQGEFSAAVAGLRPPEAALARAQAQVDHLTAGAP
jgi:multiple sugar transport system substrate-binding protein